MSVSRLVTLGSCLGLLLSLASGGVSAQSSFPGGRRMGTVYGSTDSCDPSRIIEVVTTRTRCESLDQNASSWSVMINGSCQNITDTNAVSACKAVQAYNAPTVVYGATDNCDISKIESVIYEDTDCSLMSASASSWSVKVGGVCQNISDTNVRQACVGVQADSAPHVLYGSTDTCDSSRIIGVLDSYTDCGKFSNSQSSWSIKVDGVCQNISDTSAPAACLAFQTRNARNIVYGSTDNCDSSKVIGTVNSRTNCSAFDANQSSWSVKVNGVCQNISDTNAPAACLAIQATDAQNVIYGSTDNCDPSKIEAIVDYGIACQDLSRQRSSWSIKVDGVCKNISDTNVQQACFGIQSENAPNVIYGSTDNCDTAKVISVVDQYTNCRQFSSSESSWSIKINGACRNISDTNAQNSCLAIQSEADFGRSRPPRR